MHRRTCDDMVLLRNKNKAVTDNWDENKDGSYDSVIAESINVSRFVDLKLNHKLVCPIKELRLPCCGEADYDPTRKYCMVGDVPIYNMNCLIKEDSKHVCYDETMWLNESLADMQVQTRGKNGKGQSACVGSGY